MSTFDAAAHPRTQTPGVVGNGQFATKAKGEASVDLAGGSAGVRTDDPHGGFRLAKVQRMDGMEGLAFTGTLTMDGKPVATVHQDGHGGSALVRFHDGQHSPAAQRWDATAQHQARPDAFEPDEDLVNRLELAEQMNRMRKPLVVFGREARDAFWDVMSDGYGACESFSAKVSVEAAREHLRGAQFKGRAPHVWDKDAADFLPVEP